MTKELRDLVAEVQALCGIITVTCPGLTRPQVLGLIAADPFCPERAAQLIIAAERRRAGRGRGVGSILGPTTLH